MTLPRNEYPRPQFRRDDWIMLNGRWEFEFDDAHDGAARGLDGGKVALKGSIEVPFAYQYPASGIGDASVHDTVWYRRSFSVGKDKKGSALLCFNGADYITDVWINGKHAVTHTGGFAPFKTDIAQFIKAGENVIVVRCVDPDDPTIPRGKQTWIGKRFGCWYVPTTGIWQSVWIEFAGADATDEFTVEPNIERLSFSGEIVTLNGVADTAEIKVSFGGREVKTQTVSLDGKHTRYTVDLMEVDFVGEVTYWSPESPKLYYVDVTLYCGKEKVDVAHTRFGMRSIAVDPDGNITLNGRKLYQRLILDQGYWAESGMTPPSAEAVKKDIELAKAMGFNGARKHQKFEDPYFYYYADELGFLAWCEMPSAYNFCTAEVVAAAGEWQEIVRAARYFTSVICFVPLNESWGVRKLLSSLDQQNFATMLYYLTKTLDRTRLVSTNDGWENLTATDIISVHDYARDSSAFNEKYLGSDLDSLYPHERRLMAMGHKSGGKPMLITEFGGIAMAGEAVDGNWGYNDGAKTDAEFYARLQDLLSGIADCPFQGYCYTQLTDVQQEVNGLLDADHKPKFDNSKLEKIFSLRPVRS